MGKPSLSSNRQPTLEAGPEHSALIRNAAANTETLANGASFWDQKVK